MVGVTMQMYHPEYFGQGEVSIEIVAAAETIVKVWG
jgi:hypothetical protein